MARKRSKTNETEIKIETAYISLISAIQSYYDTYRTLSYAECSVDFCVVRENREKWKKRERQINDTPEYLCDYFTSITHFQHFFEIVIKSILKNFDKLAEYKDFPRAFDKLQEIRQEKTHNDAQKEIDFLLKHRETLCELNKLRNYAWHQGVAKRNYCSYDFFVGCKILPIVLKFIDISKNSPKRQLWSYKKTYIGLDPIEEIYKEFKSQGRNADYERISFLKEMGRAAYQNPLFINEDEACDEMKCRLHRRVVQLTNRDIMNEYDAKIKNYKSIFPYSKLLRCPVCGQKTLVKFVDAGNEDVVDENGNIFCEMVEVLDKYECQVCSFRINPNIKSLSISTTDGKEVWKWKGEKFLVLEE